MTLSSVQPKRSSGRPLVTIAIPTFNRPAGLERALARAIEQDYTDIEIVISDNASVFEREVAEIVRAAQSKGRPIEFFRQPDNIGAFSNFEFLFSHARGEFLMLWPDDDDYSDLSLVSKLVELLSQDPTASAAMPCVEVKNSSGEVVAFDPTPFGLDGCSQFFRVFHYFTTDITDMLFYSMVRAAVVRDFKFSRDSFCPEKFLIFHLILSGRILDCHARITNIHTPKTFLEIEDMMGVSVNKARHDWEFLNFIFRTSPVRYKLIYCTIYLFVHAQYFSWPLRRLFRVPRERHVRWQKR